MNFYIYLNKIWQKKKKKTLLKASLVTINHVRKDSLKLIFHFQQGALFLLFYKQLLFLELPFFYYYSITLTSDSGWHVSKPTAQQLTPQLELGTWVLFISITVTVIVWAFDSVGRRKTNGEIDVYWKSPSFSFFCFSKTRKLQVCSFFLSLLLWAWILIASFCWIGCLKILVFDSWDLFVMW